MVLTEQPKDSQLPNGILNVPVIVGIVLLAIGVVVGVIVLTILVPDQPAASIMLIGFIGPIIGGLMAFVIGSQRAVVGHVQEVEKKVVAKVDDLAKDVNGRLSQLLKAKEDVAHSQGMTDHAAGIAAPTTPEIEKKASDEAAAKSGIGLAPPPAAAPPAGEVQRVHIENMPKGIEKPKR